jgi:hypothetical protein
MFDTYPMFEIKLKSCLHWRSLRRYSLRQCLRQLPLGTYPGSLGVVRTLRKPRHVQLSVLFGAFSSIRQCFKLRQCERALQQC